MNNSSLRWAAILLICTSALIVSGCSAGSDFPILDRAQTPEDEIPSSVTDLIDMSEYDLSTSRLSAIDDDREYFLIERVSGGEVTSPCLVIAGPDPLVACGGAGGAVSASSLSGREVQLVGAPAIDGDGWTAISDNIRVRPKP